MKPKITALVDVTKPKQTFLLLITYFVAYFVGSKGNFEPLKFLVATMAVFLTVSGTTALNMWLDRDIDALMSRTRNRPVPSGILSPVECAIYGAILYFIGIAFATFISFEFVVVLFLGLFFDIIIYTVLLKRRSPYSIVLGGFAGAMPALSGWVATAGFTLPGFLLAAIVLLWIPSHIWYISMHYEEDYRVAGIPMYPLVVGMEKASWAIVAATGFMLMLVTALYIVLPLNIFYPLFSISITLFFFYRAVKFAMQPNKMKAKKMYKLASMTLGMIFLSLLLGAF